MFSTFFLLLLFTIIDLFLIVSTQYHDNFTHHVVMDNFGKYHVYWHSSGVNGNDTITFEVQVATKGWIGLGLASSGAMTGADIIIVWIDNDGQPHISDRHGPSSGNGYPEIDKHADYELLYASENTTHTIVRFRRKQSTCDDEDWTITTDTVRLLWSYNDVKPQSESQLERHTDRGVRSVRMMQLGSDNRAETIFNQPDVFSIDINITKVSVPHDSSTLYWCRVFEMPKSNTRRQILGFQVLVQSGNEKYVHHMAAYGCDRRVNMSIYANNEAECYETSANEEQFMQHCQPRLFGWAVGAEPFAYPDGIASPYYGDEYDYIAVEFHYDNSDYVHDIVDSSGVRLYVTEKNFRPIETGHMRFAASHNTLSLIIPPLQSQFTMVGYCPAQCTANFENATINVFTGYLHAHTIAVKMVLRHVRNGIELPPILKDEHYDFNYQSPIAIEHPIIIQAGDDLILECTYNSQSRPHATMYGLGTQEEMCMAMLEYYPKRKRYSDNCESANQPVPLMKKLGAKAVTIDDASGSVIVTDTNDRQQPFLEWIKTLAWTDAMIASYQWFIRNNSHSLTCGINIDSSTMPTDSHYNLTTNPSISIPFDSSDPFCRNQMTSSSSDSIMSLVFVFICTIAVFFTQQHGILLK